jgi:hypothetical protein
LRAAENPARTPGPVACRSACRERPARLARPPRGASVSSHEARELRSGRSERRGGAAQRSPAAPPGGARRSAERGPGEEKRVGRLGGAAALDGPSVPDGVSSRRIKCVRSICLQPAIIRESSRRPTVGLCRRPANTCPAPRVFPLPLDLVLSPHSLGPSKIYGGWVVRRFSVAFRSFKTAKL